MRSFRSVKFLMLWMPVFILFCVLGKWQLSRYHFKSDLIAAASSRLSQQPMPFLPVQTGQMAPEAFLRLTLKGTYQNDAVILVQNQFYHHRVGVEVLTPVLIPGDKKWILIDRGWHALSSAQGVPVIPPVQGFQNIRGYLLPASEYRFILGPNIRQPDQRPLLIQKIDPMALSRIFKKDFYPFVLKLDANEAFGFERDPQPNLVLPVPPERHLGYAFQWFAMAAVLLVACLFYVCRLRTMKKLNNRFPLIALILVFALPMIAAWVLFYFHNYFGGATVNHGTLMTPLVRTKEDNTHRWQVVYVPSGVCGKNCAETTHKLKQMVKLLGQKQRRVITICQLSLEHLPKGRIYLVDPLGNIFMYYAPSANPLDIYRDLKHLLNISQIG